MAEGAFFYDIRTAPAHTCLTVQSNIYQHCYNLQCTEPFIIQPYSSITLNTGLQLAIAQGAIGVVEPCVTWNLTPRLIIHYNIINQRLVHNLAVLLSNNSNSPFYFLHGC